ncbi:unnamed protein product [Lathyrus sativus]|nr:unnamed protein product [Lathyrus sativus]
MFPSPSLTICSQKYLIKIRTSCYLHFRYNSFLASSLLALRVPHNNSFLNSSNPNPSIISTPLPLSSFLLSSPTLLPPADLFSLSSTVCGLNKPYLFNLPSNKSSLLNSKPVCLPSISRTRLLK